MASLSEVTREDFRKWLENKLTSAGLDSDVYGEYIYGTLKVSHEEREDESDEEEMESQLKDILDGIIESDCTSFCQDIIQKWSTTTHPVSSSSLAKKKNKSLSSKPIILEEHVTVHKDTKREQPIKGEGERGGGKGHSILSEEEKKQLVTQFGSSYISDDDEIDEQNGEEPGLFTSNTNKSLVTMALKEKREEERRAHIEKKEQIKVNQRQQQQRQQERKEKEKQRTQKRERKR